jgi:hypothetical protein
MKPLQPIELTRAEPVDYRGKRLPMTLLHLTVRDHFLRLAADIHCVGMSDRQAAAYLHKRLARYRECAWQRDAPEECCPPRLAGRVNGLMWVVLKCSDRVVSQRLIRMILSRTP